MKFNRPCGSCGKLALTTFALSLATAVAQLPAFPGAEGFGAHANGGRGGDVYYVTNLNSSGAGSLLYGIDNAPSSGRTIVFAVSGYIPIANNSHLGNKTLRLVQNRITIAGQTAPGDGIGLKDGRILLTGNNQILSNFRIRHGKNGGAGDCLNVDNSAHNSIIRNISMQFSTDENISFFNSSLDNFTMQESLSAWGLESHNAGGLWDLEHGTVYQSLWAHHHTRNPKARPYGLLEWVNNVTFDWGIGMIMGDSETPAPWKANVIGSYFLSPPSYTDSTALEKARVDRNGNPNFSLYLNDCLHDSDGDGQLNGTNKGYSIVAGSEYQSGDPVGANRYVKSVTPFPGATGNIAVSVDDPLTAYKKVISSAGAVRMDAAYSGPLRDEVDTILFNNVVTQQHSRITRESDLPVSNNGFGTLNSSPAPSDADLDGMPDFWEQALGFNSLADDHNTAFSNTTGTFFPVGTPAGYTRLEEYLHFLTVPHITIGKNTVETPSSFTSDLRKFTSGFSNSPAFTIASVTGGTIEQFASDGITPSSTGPIVRFTPTQDTHGRAGFKFTVTDSEGSTWTRQFAVLLTTDITLPPPVRINVDFDEGTPYSGTAAAPDTGTVWNVFPETLGSTSLTVPDVVTSTGSPTPYDVSISTTGSELKVYTQATSGNPAPVDLMGDYAYGGTFTVTISELPEGEYHLYVYAHGDNVGQGSTVTIDAANGGGTATAGTTGTQYRNLSTSGAEGYSYLKFEPAVGPSGTLVFTASSYLNGFQLVTPPAGNYFVNMTQAAGNTGTTQAIPSMPGWDYSAAAPVPGDTWNVFNETNYNSSFPNPLNPGQTWTIASNVPLTTADGLDRAATLTMAYHAVTDALTSDRLNTISGVGTVQPDGVMEQLMRNYWDRGGSGNFQRITLGGLEPNSEYLLYIYSASNGSVSPFRAWIDLDQNGSIEFDTLDDLSTDALFVSTGGGNYGLTAQGHVWNKAVDTTDGSGNLVFDSRGHLNGFQVIEYEAPQILDQPENQTVSMGEQATFSVIAEALPEPSYQWYKGGGVIPGANGPTLTIATTDADDAGEYAVEVSNEGSAVMSAVVELAFFDPYSNYMLGFGLDPETDGAEGLDYEHDGLENLLEFFLGTDPTTSDPPDERPSATRSGEDLMFVFRRLKQAADLPFAVEFTSDPSLGWTAAVHGENEISIVTDDLDDEFDQVTVTIPIEASRMFARLRVIAPS